MNIFGIALAPLIVAIAEVESNRGASSDNVYQIREIYVTDVNRILGEHRYRYSDVFSRTKSEGMMEAYWLYYGSRYLRETGRRPTAETLARIHNGGPRGWEKPETLSYWLRVKSVLEGGTK